MQLEVGNIIEGKVTGITKFGAFVELPGGKTGMVHISEVATTYVKEISDHLAENQMVKVKVLSISDDGKVSLSIKKCQDAGAAPAQGGHTPPPRRFPPREGGGGGRGGHHGGSGGRVWQPKRQASTDNMSFEDMMTRFKQTSDDKMSDLKRGGDSRRPKRGSK